MHADDRTLSTDELLKLFSMPQPTEACFERPKVVCPNAVRSADISARYASTGIVA